MDNFVILIINVLYIFSLLSVIVTGQNSLSGPNRAIEEGQTVVLPCQSLDAYPNTFAWNRNGRGVSRNTRISRGLPNRYTVTGDEGQQEYNLQITDTVAADDGGIYFCSFVYSLVFPVVVHKHYVFLTILGNFVCESEEIQTDGTVLPFTGVVRAKETLRVTCNPSYTGRWAPIIQCTSSVFGLNSTTNDTTNTQLKYISDFYVPAGESTGQIDCSLYFTDIGVPSDGKDSSNADVFYSHNVPDLTLSWSSGLVNVQYAPTNIVIQPNKTSYEVGDQITCMGSANPPGSYVWFDTATNLELGTGTITLAADTDVVYQCVGTNAAGENRVTVQITFQAETTTTPPTTTVITTGVNQASTINGQSTLPGGSTNNPSTVNPGGSTRSTDDGTQVGSTVRTPAPQTPAPGTQAPTPAPQTPTPAPQTPAPSPVQTPTPAPQTPTPTQVQTTQVPEEEIAWWVWLLLAIGLLCLVIAVIVIIVIYCDKRNEVGVEPDEEEEKPSTRNFKPLRNESSPRERIYID